MPSGRDSFRRNRVAPIGPSILPRPARATRHPPSEAGAFLSRTLPSTTGKVCRLKLQRAGQFLPVDSVIKIRCVGHKDKQRKLSGVQAPSQPLLWLLACLLQPRLVWTSPIALQLSAHYTKVESQFADRAVVTRVQTSLHQSFQREGGIDYVDSWNRQ